jgi:glycerate kinase
MTAVIEMAEASGLPLVPKAERDPLRATTYGTGELIKDALAKGATKLIIGIGGSATVDGGCGMAQALGVRFFDAGGKQIQDRACGGILESIASIDVSALDKSLRKAEVIIASDVDNPLIGPRGAARVFGPQKGATPEMVQRLDAGLKHLGIVIKKDLKKDVMKLAGAGAAGGLGAGLVAFAGAKLRSGVGIVVDAAQLHKHVKGATLVITGEGRVDFQTAFGKTPSGVAKVAKKHKVPVVAVGGGLADDAHGVFAHGIDALETATARDMDLAYAIAHSREYLANAGERIARWVLVAKKMAKSR